MTSKGVLAGCAKRYAVSLSPHFYKYHSVLFLCAHRMPGIKLNNHLTSLPPNKVQSSNFLLKAAVWFNVPVRGYYRWGGATWLLQPDPHTNLRGQTLTLWAHGHQSRPGNNQAFCCFIQMACSVFYWSWTIIILPVLGNSLKGLSLEK